MPAKDCSSAPPQPPGVPELLKAISDQCYATEERLKQLLDGHEHVKNSARASEDRLKAVERENERLGREIELLRNRLTLLEARIR